MNTIIEIMLWSCYLLSLYFAVFWVMVFFDTQKRQKKIMFNYLRKYPKVSILIPAYNEEDSIIPTIEHVLKLEYPKRKLEIIVVDDGSTDKTAELVKKIQKTNNNIKLIVQENKGKGAALNKGLKCSTGEYFVCLDADSFVKPDALMKLLPLFSNEKIACVLPLLKVKDPKNKLQKMQWYEYIINIFYKELMGRLNCIHVAPGPFSVYKKKHTGKNRRI